MYVAFEAPILFSCSVKYKSVIKNTEKDFQLFWDYFELVSVFNEDGISTSRKTKKKTSVDFDCGYQ